ncbi:LysE family translocator [Actinomadura flavalba]|uniref:LysE family translocator n=1 Tax=Actinomadura flavalba TaxID=1120938 RepID=UPI000362E63F|nr:LysE family translocator [Actinomadura flavalba]
MVTTGAVLGIMLVELGMVLVPGPNMVYLVTRSVTQGRMAGFVSLAGVAVGFACYMCATAFGLSALFTYVPALYTVLKIAGALYLLWLAWQTLRPGGTSMFDTGGTTVDPPLRLFTMGLVTNLLNPKIAMLYMSLLPQFIDPSRGSVAVQSLILGLAQIAVAVTVSSLIVLGAGTAAAFLRTRPTWQRVQRYVTGTVLGALALHLGLSRPAT